MVHNVVAEKGKAIDKGTAGRVFAHSKDYQNYVVMEVIVDELLRNILLALLCVFLATLLLIADVVASLIVLLNVLLTLVNVGKVSRKIFLTTLLFHGSRLSLFKVALCGCGASPSTPQPPSYSPSQWG